MEKWTIQSALSNAVSKTPDKVFLYEGDKQLTFKELDERTDRLAYAFLKEGIKRGDNIGIIALNQFEWLYTFFAAAKIGAGVVALNVRYRESEFEYMINNANVKALVSISSLADFNYSDFFDHFRGNIPTVRKFIFTGEGFEGSLHFSDLMVQEIDIEQLNEAKDKVVEEDTAVIIYTSGTTGRPKGTLITNRSILASAKAHVGHFEIKSSDLSIGNLPLNHVGGITCSIMVALLSQSSVVLIPMFNPSDVLEAIEKHRATIFGGVPTMYVMLLNSEKRKTTDLTSLRLCVAGGSNVEPELCQRINKEIPNGQLVNLYGLSESSGACVLSRLTDDLSKVQKSIGVPIGDFEAKVVNKERKTVPIGEVGELAIKGACVAKGYYGMEKETKETFGEENWLYTGDLVYTDSEGYLYYKGRKKEMYIQGGYNIYPVEIENILSKHPKVLMAAGFGVPDEFYGEVGRYYIVPTPGEQPTDEELTNYCKQHLADYKIPKQFIFKEDVPLTPAGKIQKSLLRKEFEEMKEGTSR
ncbi:long-chain fatty acid--CoA ligase [Pueribacillus theae]|uniref:Long-chain fatty acid--CoA ligase n=1 Tax=Pueribacillus theae TaxID=2171751 RepID=A0A2U1K5Z6_9BACI|nr:AMP-binding protein [Pueribacillus theae]PWA12802.1 long-chain fatty acid--CoA ligase [Pueribacillus theae]